MGSRKAEAEVKLTLDPDVGLPSLDGIAEDVEVADADPVELTATYFDTADLRLIRAGATVRHRPEGGSAPAWQVKTPLPGSTGVIVRDEQGFDGPPTARPPADALARVASLSRCAPLVPVATLVSRRHALRLLRDGEVVAEVADDLVTGSRADEVIARFREVEVETDDKVLRKALVARLADVGAEVTGNHPKLVRVLGPEAIAPPDVQPPPLLEPDRRRPVVDVVSQALMADLDRWIRHDPGTRDGRDIEQLHQMRVAIRRLRTTLRIYRDLLDADWAEHLRAQLAPLGTHLGAVRDLDVLTLRIRTDLDEIGGPDTLPARRLLGMLADQREAAREALLTTMDCPAYGALLDQVLAAARSPQCLDPTSPAGPALAPLVDHAWKRLRKAVRRDAHLHLVRLRAKRLRYAAEAVEPVFGRPARKLADRAGRVQDVLGVVQDAEVAIERHTAMAGTADPAVAFLLGQLTEMARRRMVQAEGRWPAEWTALRRKKLRAFLD